MQYRYWMIVKDFFSKGSDLKAPVRALYVGKEAGTPAGYTRDSPTTELAADEFKVVRERDSISPKFSTQLLKQNPFGTVIVVGEKSTGKEYRQFLNYEMSNVRLRTLMYGGSADGNRPLTEDITCSFDRVALHFSVVDENSNAAFMPGRAF